MKILSAFVTSLLLALAGHASGCADDAVIVEPDAADSAHALCRVWTTCDGEIRTAWVLPADAPTAIAGCEAELRCLGCGERSACATECP